MRFQYTVGVHATARASSPRCAPGSSYDRKRRSDPAHADSEGGAEAHPGVPAPKVKNLFTRVLKTNTNKKCVQCVSDRLQGFVEWHLLLSKERRSNTITKETEGENKGGLFPAQQ